MRITLIITILILASYCILWGYGEEDREYNEEYIRTIGTIIDKKIESIDLVEKEGSNKFKHKKKFRIRLTYKYKVDDKEFQGNYYNDGSIDNGGYLDDKDYIPIGNMYNYVKKINVYYNSEKPYDSCVKLEQIRKKNNTLKNSLIG